MSAFISIKHNKEYPRNPSY